MRWIIRGWPGPYADVLGPRLTPNKTSCRQETITLGSHSIPTGDRDRESSDYRFFPGLTQPWNIYTTTLLPLTPDGIYKDLVATFLAHLDLLHNPNRAGTNQ